MKRILLLIVPIVFFAGCASNTPSTVKYARTVKKPHHTVQLTHPVTMPATTSINQQVVLLLPLSGTLASAGTAIRDGYIAAAQQAGNAANVETVDTNQVKPISSAYQQAVAKGATMVVGPLEKSAVAELVRQYLPVRTLALNQIQDAHNPNLYQFGLSPLDEARQVAERAARDGHHRVLLIIPAGSWGNGVAQAFSARWSELGGTINRSLRFKLQDNLAERIKDALDAGGWRASKKQHHDFDVIFIAAPPALARQIKPLLKFYYAGQIPIYATSFIYTGAPQPLLDHDLNGIIFCDIPWVITPQPLAEQLAQKDPRNFAENARLYALGVDAYRLAIQLNDLQASIGAYIQGVTGELYLAPEKQILRRLTWARFQNGQPIPLTK